MSVKEYEDGRSHDPAAVRRITQSWVDCHMKARESQFTEAASCDIFCGTWNVNAKKQDGGLEPWLLPSNYPIADIYAVGFQEIVDLNAMNVALDGSKTQQRTQFWKNTIADCLLTVPQFRFVLVAEKHLVGLLLVVYAKEDLARNIRDVRVASTGVGLMGMMGNKGGVSVRMSVYDSGICFVCSHLAAHRENVAGRNADFKNIIDRTVLASDLPDVSATSESGTGVEQPLSPSLERDVGNIAGDTRIMRRDSNYNIGRDLSILDHEVVFWLGDLNYRIGEDLTTDEVFRRIETNEIASLRAADQLNVERSKGAVFQGFEEGLLGFLPTYKFQPGTGQYDRRPEKKIRAPAWCDRVLWRTATTAASLSSSSPALPPSSSSPVRQVNYRCAELLPSDHKPVSALFSVDLRIVIAEKERNVYQELVNTLEYWKSTQPPIVEVSGLELKFADVKYAQNASLCVTAKNTGTVLAHWHLLPKLEDGNRISKRWLRVDKQSGLLLPGESAEIEVTVHVDTKTAHALNQGKDVLEDLLVLRVENFNDFYVSVEASYLRSCFGMSLEELACISLPVRATALPMAAAITALSNIPGANNDSSTASVDLLDADPFIVSETPRAASAAAPVAITAATVNCVPKELWRLVDALYGDDALKEKGLFQTDADDHEVELVRESLDSGTAFSPCTPHALTAAMIAFLAALPRPLIPSDLLPAHMAPAEVNPLWVKTLLDNMPPLNYTVLVYVLSFLREVLTLSGYNRTSIAVLARVCVECMTASPNDPEISRDEKNARSTRQALALAALTFWLGGKTTSS